MGSGASVAYNNRRPEVHFEISVYPSLKSIFTLLGFTNEEAMQLFQAFVHIDKKRMGMIELAAFYKYYGIKATKFTHRVFTFLDKDGNGLLDMKEYMTGIWNYCTYDAKQIAKVAFGFFDVDHRGLLDMSDVDALLRMVYDTEEADWSTVLEIFEAKERSEETEISLETFAEKVMMNPKILQPALELQRIIRRKSLGLAFWQGQQQRREREFREFDEKAGESWEGLLLILEEAAKKDKEEQEGNSSHDAAAEGEEEEGLLSTEEQDEKQDAEMDKMMAKYILPEEIAFKEAQRETMIIMRRERQAFEDRKLLYLAASETEEDKAELEARARLEVLQQDLLNTKYTIDQVMDRVAKRRELWEAVAEVTRSSQKAHDMREQKAGELARGRDADLKCDAYITIDVAGIKRFDVEVLLQYGKVLKEGHKTLGGMFDPPAPGKTAWATEVAFKYWRSKQNLEKARRRARLVILEEIRNEDYQKVKCTFAEKAAIREKELAELNDRLMADGGTVGSKWELLWDLAQEAPLSYVYHVERKEKVYGEVAICERCDHRLLNEDIRCTECSQPRSVKNKKLYRRLSGG